MPFGSLPDWFLLVCAVSTGNSADTLRVFLVVDIGKSLKSDGYEAAWGVDAPFVKALSG
jgi:hypothetical protein